MAAWIFVGRATPTRGEVVGGFATFRIGIVPHTTRWIARKCRSERPAKLPTRLGLAELQDGRQIRRSKLNRSGARQERLRWCCGRWGAVARNQPPEYRSGTVQTLAEHRSRGSGRGLSLSVTSAVGTGRSVPLPFWGTSGATAVVLWTLGRRGADPTSGIPIRNDTNTS